LKVGRRLTRRGPEAIAPGGNGLRSCGINAAGGRSLNSSFKVRGSIYISILKFQKLVRKTKSKI